MTHTGRIACFWLVSGLLLCVNTGAWADAPPEKLVVATWNVEWLFDDHAGDNYSDLAKQQSAPSRPDWDWKLAGVAQAIAEIRPTILALQEIENQRVLFYLTRRLKQEHGLDYAISYVEGGDFFTEQDVAVLSLGGLTGFGVKRQTDGMFRSKQFYNVTKHLFCEFEWGAGADRQRLLLLNVHLRAQASGTEIRKKQAKLIRHWIGPAIAAGDNVIVLGDINTNESYEATTEDGDIGTLRGLDTSPDDDDLADLFQHYAGESKETHLVHKQFDHILVTPSLLADAPGVSDLVFRSLAIRKDLVVRGQGQDQEHRDIYWQIPATERDISDHYPVVAEFEFRK
ncbi:MAG: endonuclease/exonuclease/phosphatase family protein [Pirellulaceae bacterium]